MGLSRPRVAHPFEHHMKNSDVIQGHYLGVRLTFNIVAAEKPVAALSVKATVVMPVTTSIQIQMTQTSLHTTCQKDIALA